MTIDTDNGHVRWVRAGHDPAILYDPVQDKFEKLKGVGVALGLDEKFAYEENLKTELERCMARSASTASSARMRMRRKLTTFSTPYITI
jgi:hypothetical protein